MFQITITLLVVFAVGVKGQVEQQLHTQATISNTSVPIPSLNVSKMVNNKTDLPTAQNTANNQIQPIRSQSIFVDGRTLTQPALFRLFYVLLGLSTITICYVVYRLYRIRNGGTRPAAVRKYGVLAQRSDIEMEPLHLDDEEDDDTVFDRGAHANR